ncbi:hypothetical protein [uncultured Mucilaginibacter sp.]|uniref:hypothetical protein n=1 Tax=uncultured Mucilaginibacter sp. TaxID=797541 RepID=UPI0025EE7C4D|nr:hypothetical protein [uncultured Mucilaginibacter sp.]
MNQKMIRINQKLKDKLRWLVISVDYDYSRICIADHDMNSETLTLWLEDKQDFKNSLDDCLQLEIPAKQFAKIIKEDNLNSFIGSKMHPSKKYVYRARIEINEALAWYNNDATIAEQGWAREAVLKQLLTQLIETEAHGIEEWI